MSSQTIKITFNEEIRRLPFAPEKGVQGVLDLCATCFNLKKTNAFQLTYQDAEGDTIILSTNEELATLFKGTDTAKLTLQRRNFKKAGGVPATEAPAETSASTTSEATEVKGKVKKDKQEKKRARKEKKEALKRQILNTKVVRLRWKDLNEVPAPAEGEKVCPRKRARKEHKGCYVGANLKGKVKFNAGLGKKSLWLAHELESGVLFSPVSAPRRYLRVCSEGTVNLSNGGAGPRTRWTQTVDGNTGTSELVSQFNKLQLTGVSVGKKLKNKGKCAKKRVVPRCLDLTASTPENIATKHFWVEDVNVTDLLVKTLKKLSNRRRAARRMRKDCRKNWKNNLKTQEEEEKRRAKGKGKGKGKGQGRCHGRKGRKGWSTSDGESTQQTPGLKGEYIC